MKGKRVDINAWFYEMLRSVKATGFGMTVTPMAQKALF
jgi:hypothetical protein